MSVGPTFFETKKKTLIKNEFLSKLTPPPPPPTHIYTLAHFWISVKRLRFEVITPAHY